MKKSWLIKWWRLQWWFIKWRSRLMMVLIVFMCSLGTYVWNFRAHEISKNPESWAHFGDYLGGIFSFFSFMALLYTVHLQIQELKATREELKATREELKLSRQVQQESAEAQEQSAEVLRKQQFENTFFQLLNQVTLHLNKLTENKTNQTSIINQLHNLNYFNFPKRLVNLIRFTKISSNGSYTWRINELQQKYDDAEPDFSQFCLLVYQVLKLIKNSPYASQDEKPATEEKQYSNFLRAILTPQILQLMAIYCYRDEKSQFKSYQQLIERYAIFEHMPFYLKKKDDEQNRLIPTITNAQNDDTFFDRPRYSELLIYLYYKYDRSAFGDNETLKLIEPELKKISIE